MKTVGIVTYFKSYNYGVWLQAYATERFFEKEGFDAYIINYANRLENQTTKLAFKEKNRISGYFISFLKAIIFGRVTYYLVIICMIIINCLQRNILHQQI